MLDYIFLTASDTDRSIAFYEPVLPVLGITNRLDYDGKDGRPGHPDLKGFGAQPRMFFWLRQGRAALGATQIHPPGLPLHDDPRHYAAQVRDPDGYGLESVYKSWQHEL